MKKLSVIAMFLALFLASCSGGDAEKVAQKWLVAFWHLDYDEAELYSTKETINVLKIFKSLDDKVLSDSARTEAQKVKIKIKDVLEEGDRATVTYTSSVIPDDQTIYLVRQNNQWLVQITKEDIFADKDTMADPDSNPNIVADTTTTHVAGDTSAADVTE